MRVSFANYSARETTVSAPSIQIFLLVYPYMWQKLCLLPPRLPHTSASPPLPSREIDVRSTKTGGETFADVLQTEAAKNKSLKIDHAALQRVMNMDGSLKQLNGERWWPTFAREHSKR